jgi:acyl-CoA dehydrogenase
MTAFTESDVLVEDTTKQLRDTLRLVFAEHAPQHAGEPGIEWPSRLWATLNELGVTRLTLPESAGGSGGGLTDAAALLLVAGEVAAAAPLAETDLLAGWLLHLAGLPVPADEPLATVLAEPAQLEISALDGAETLTVTGRLSRVGWARCAARIAVLAREPGGSELVLSIDPRADGVTVVEGVNVAGEPRDALVLDAVRVAEVGAVPTPDQQSVRELLARRATLARALLLAGAASGALTQSVRYAGERVQFGRAIAQFQAVQQQLALAAAEVAAARAAVDAAVHAAAASDLAGDAAGFAIAAAKARAGEAAGEVARIAHQVHGAIGFTLEHSLRLVTTRLWSWRDEDGDDAVCNAHIARAAIGAGPDGLWPLLTGAG